MKWVLVILFPLNPASPASFLFKKIKLCCDVSGDYLLFYSWFYVNFPLFYWNIARIPVATTFLFWWCTTLVKFGWEVAPQRFLFEWKSAGEKFGREVAPPRFHFQSKSASHAKVAPPLFYFRTDFPFSCFRRGGRSRHIWPKKESHVLSTYKRQEHASKTRAKREKHARNMQVYPGADYTAPAPSSPSLKKIGRGYYPCRCHVEIMLWCCVRNCLSFMSLP